MNRRELLMTAGIYGISAMLPDLTYGKARQKAKGLCIIFDDAGGSRETISSLERLAKEGVTANIAVLPGTRLEKEALDILVGYNNADVLLHQPMEPHDLEHNWPEEHIPKDLGKCNPVDCTAIYNCHSPEKAYDIVKKNAEHLNRYLDRAHRNIAGLNNHMGSRVTEDWRLMLAVSRYARDNGLVVIDSRTSANSVFYETAFLSGARAYKSRMFIDRHAEKKLRKLLEFPKQIVAIGHLQYRETVDAYVRVAKDERMLKVSGLQ